MSPSPTNYDSQRGRGLASVGKANVNDRLRRIADLDDPPSTVRSGSLADLSTGANSRFGSPPGAGGEAGLAGDVIVPVPLDSGRLGLRTRQSGRASDMQLLVDRVVNGCRTGAVTR